MVAGPPNSPSPHCAHTHTQPASLLDNDICADPAKIAGSIFDFTSRTYAAVLVGDDAHVDHQRARIAHAIVHARPLPLVHAPCAY